MFGGARRGARSVILACSVATLGAVLLLPSGTATGSSRPVISGNPVVGQVLTSSPASTGFGLYKWQSCDPAVADCSDSLEHNDPNWTDLTGEDHNGQSYTAATTDLGHFIRVLIHDNNLGDHWATSAPVGPVRTGAAPPQPVTPEHGVFALGSAIDGSVTVKLPGHGGFESLGSGKNKLPVGTVIDTRGGRVRLVAATGNLGNKTPDQSSDFYGGVFRINQDAASDSPLVAQLAQKLACGPVNGKKARASSGGPVAVAAGHRRRRLWGSGHGSYATSGGGGTGSVRGTTWLTQDTCKGTLFRVAEGLGITVFDTDLDKHVDLGPGQSYFAKKR
jgi:hypothetical protein